MTPVEISLVVSLAGNALLYYFAKNFRIGMITWRAMYAKTNMVPTVHRDRLSVQSDWEEFWKPLVTINGEVSLEQIKRELSDYRFIMEQLPKVYSHVTGGKLSKHMYDADLVCNMADDYENERWEDHERELRETWMLENADEKLTDELIDLRAKLESAIRIRKELGPRCEQLNHENKQLKDKLEMKEIHIKHLEEVQNGARSKQEEPQS